MNCFCVEEERKIKQLTAHVVEGKWGKIQRKFFRWLMKKGNFSMADVLNAENCT